MGVAVALGHDAGDGLLEEVRLLLLDRLPVVVLHDVRVVLLAVVQRVALQVLDESKIYVDVTSPIIKLYRGGHRSFMRSMGQCELQLAFD